MKSGTFTSPLTYQTSTSSICLNPSAGLTFSHSIWYIDAAMGIGASTDLLIL